MQATLSRLRQDNLCREPVIRPTVYAERTISPANSSGYALRWPRSARFIEPDRRLLPDDRELFE
jgi:hypothetical protein